jgi:hypothetical protein
MYRASADDRGTVQALAQDLDEATPPTPTSQPLLLQAAFFDYVVIDQNQFSASRRSASCTDSLVAARTNVSGRLWVGELVDIFVIKQTAMGIHRLGHVRWFVPSKVDTAGVLGLAHHSHHSGPIT